jgi:iron(III) transport system ATP-binding protein
VASVGFEQVSKRFGATRAVDRVDLAVADGEFLALLGPSGCGKTTLLRLVAGFEALDDGTVRIAGEAVGRPGWSLPPERRHVGMVFQSYALWPHMTVSENVGFALKVRRVGAPERERCVAAALDTVGLAGFAGRKPRELSGGQRQRVALARCLAMRPRVVLLDEPLANLDAHLRESMQEEFARFHREIGATFIYVTHDQAEAMALADRVAVMDRGRLEQIARPQALYREPASEMVARFVGRGAILPVEVVAEKGAGLIVDLWGRRVPARGAGRPGERRSLCLRAADARLAAPDEPNTVPGRVTAASFQGASTLLKIRPDGDIACEELQVEHRGPAPPLDAAVAVAVTDGWLIPAGTAAGSGSAP